MAKRRRVDPETRVITYPSGSQLPPLFIDPAVLGVPEFVKDENGVLQLATPDESGSDEPEPEQPAGGGA